MERGIASGRKKMQVTGGVGQSPALLPGLEVLVSTSPSMAGKGGGHTGHARRIRTGRRRLLKPRSIQFFNPGLHIQCLLHVLKYPTRHIEARLLPERCE